MDAIALVVIALASWSLIRIGIRVGGSKASRYIVEVFIRKLDLKSNSEDTWVLKYRSENEKL
jgi:hypothetical protein